MQTNPTFDNALAKLHFRRFYNAANPLLQEIKAGIEERAGILCKKAYPELLYITHSNDDLQALGSKKYDAIASLFVLHTDHNPIQSMKEILTHLNAGGVFLATVFGGQTLQELREAMLQTDLELLSGVSPRIYPMINIKDFGMLAMQAGFKNPVSDSEVFTYEFNNVIELINFTRSLGYSNCLTMRNKTTPPKNYFTKLEENYKKYSQIKQCNEQGARQVQHLQSEGYKATFEVITLGACI